ncbi:LPXTG cell wall anchor domain-containing protein [Nitriliruptor alkaliphilus]|uniref:LPXTG cell wall anchor domain-containing protein n=1 Tax=Nitriliruptor alkaliphilus TaxID=427918 RepID=UPI000698CE83|nr:LPXTG cell wall anchor domain-containing protein [Nitriliruptor alkaliphilus]
MNRTRTRALLAAAALGVATIAFPVAASASEAAETCNHLHPDLEKIEGGSGSYTDVTAHGTISWDGATLTYDLNPGWTLDICLKSATNVERTDGLTGAGSVSTSTGQDISHIAYGLDFEEPSDDDGDTDDDGVATDDDGTDDDGTDDDGTDDDGVATDDDGTDDGTDEDGTDDDGTEVQPGGEVAPVDGDGDDDGTVTEVPVDVLPATLDSRLPNTGSDVPALLAAAALALGLGGTALVRTRRGATSA